MLTSTTNLQDTVLGLEALAAFATLIAAPVEGSGIVVSVKSDSDNILHTLDPITQNNVLLLQSVKVWYTFVCPWNALYSFDK